MIEQQLKVGIYPGTFDPIHNGHLAFARQAANIFGLNKVLLLPEESPRGKYAITDISYRIALIKMVIESDPKLAVVGLRSTRFTVQETLPEVKSLLSDAAMTLLVGSDILKTMGNWDKIAYLLSQTSLAIGLRGDDTEDLRTHINRLEQTLNIPITYKIIKTDQSHMTSSMVRQGLINGSLIHPSMPSYIKRHGLYKT